MVYLNCVCLFCCQSLARLSSYVLFVFGLVGKAGNMVKLLVKLPSGNFSADVWVMRDQSLSGGHCDKIGKIVMSILSNE